MKIRNPSYDRPLAVIKGRTSPKRAGTTGMTFMDAQGNEVTAPDAKVIGATVSGEDGELVVITINGSGQEAVNDAGAAVDYGDVVVLNADGTVTTTTTPEDTRPVGVVQLGSSDGDPAQVIFSGYVAQVNTTGTVNAGDYLETSTSAGLAQSAGTSRGVGSFGRALAAGPNPPAFVWGIPDASDVTASDVDAAVDAKAGWDTIIVKSGDTGVTNSIALVTAADLQFSITAGQIWRVEVEILYTSDATGDMKCVVNMSTGAGTFWTRYVGTDSVNNTILTQTAQRDSSGSGATAIAGGGSTAVIRHIFYECVVKDTGTGTVQLQFAQQVATLGQTATIKAGSIMRLKRLV